MSDASAASDPRPDGGSSLAERLERLGLSETEVETYLAILEHGGAKASTIAGDADVSKRYVYSIAERLAERGFVEVDDHVTPTILRATPPEEVLAELTEDIEALRPQLERRFSSTQQELGPFEVIKSRPTVIKRIRQLLDSAEQEVTLSIPPGLLEDLEDALSAAVDRGVLVLLLLAGDDVGTEELADHVDGVASAVRCWGENNPLMLTVDNASALVAPYHMVAWTNAEGQAIALTQQQLAPVFVGSFLGNYWPVAEEIHLAEPRPLPATFSGFRNAVFQATLYLRDGVDLIATVDGRRVDSVDEFETISAPVVDVRQSLIAPATNSFALENSLVLDVGDGSVSIGGSGAFVEEYVAQEVVLDRAEAVEVGLEAMANGTDGGE